MVHHGNMVMFIKISLLHKNCACAMDNCNGIGYYKCKHVRYYSLNQLDTATFVIYVIYNTVGPLVAPSLCRDAIQLVF